jgi:hypothetical protein
VVPNDQLATAVKEKNWLFQVLKNGLVKISLPINELVPVHPVFPSSLNDLNRCLRWKSAEVSSIYYRMCLDRKVGEKWKSQFWNRKPFFYRR